MGKKLLSIIIPCYNEEKTVETIYVAITDTMDMLPQYDYEILFVNDGSKDNTLNKLTGLSEMDGHVKYYSFSRNFGKEAAIYAGLNNARGDYVVIMDADMQDPPALLPEMISTLESGEYDSVATRRVSRKGEPMVRSFCARCFYKLIRRISDADIVDGARDFRMMTRDMVNSVLALSEYNRFSKGIFGWVGYRTKWLEYENIERTAGETKWSFWKLLAVFSGWHCQFFKCSADDFFLPWNFDDVYFFCCNHIYHCSKAYFWRSGQWMAIPGMYHYVCWWNSIVLYGNHGTISV